MRVSLLTPGVVAVLALAACDGQPGVRISRSETAPEAGVLRAVDALNCPEQQGVLTRTATAADGLSCAYSGPRGAQVSLRLIRLEPGQEAAAVLAEVERELGALMPETLARAGAAAPAAPSTTDGTGERVDVSLPGLRVRTEGERAQVRLPGITIDADEGSSRVRITGVQIADGGAGEDVQVGGSGADNVSITAQNDSAEIRTSRGDRGVHGTYILVDEQPSAAGWRVVGYEARGPAGGPIVVAVVLSKNRREEEVFNAAKGLVVRNVGGS